MAIQLASSSVFWEKGNKGLLSIGIYVILCPLAWSFHGAIEGEKGVEQLDFFTVPSPCVGVCQANNRGYCKGCFRSRDERFYWQQLTNEQKRNVIRLCRQRYLRVKRAQAQQVGSNEPDTGESPQQELF